MALYPHPAPCIPRPLSDDVTLSSPRQAMWKMMQLDEPQDLVISTGEVHSVREFVEAAFAEVGP